MQRLLRRLWSTLWLAFALVVILFAIALGALRLLLPLAPQYRADIQAWAADALHRPVEIEGMAASWHGLGPVIELKGVTVLSREDHQTLLNVRELHLGVNLLDSLRHWTVRPSHIRVVGTQLVLERLASGKIRLRDFKPHPEHRLPPPRVIAAWMLSQPRLSLAESELAWLDHTTGRHMRFRDVELTLNNQGQRHQLTAEGGLPEGFGERFTLKADFTGPGDTPERWAGHAYVSGQALALARWWEWLGRGDVAIAEGRATALELWGRWGGGRVAQLAGVVDGEGLVVTRAGGEPLRLEHAGGRFRWQRRPGGWRVALDQLTLTRAGHRWPASQAAATFTHGPQGAPRAAVHASYLRLEDVRAMAALAPAGEGGVGETLQALAPQGELRDVRMRFAGDRPPRERLTLEASAHDVGMRSHRRLPGFEGLDADIRLAGASGRVTLRTHDASLTFPGLFREPLPLGRAEGAVHWERADGSWRIASDGLALANPAVEGQARFQLRLPDTGPARLELVGDYRAPDAAQVPHYLPAGVIPEQAMGWLDQAFQGGRVVDGHLLFDGPIAGFPFDDGGGRFEVGFGVEDGVFSYRRGWPVLRDLTTQVRFTGRGLQVRELRARVFDVGVSANIDIANLARPAVDVTGQAHGPLADLVRYLAAGPGRGEGYEDLARRLETGGRATLGLDLDVEIGGRADFRGELALDDATVSMPGWPGQLSELNGALTFTPQRLEAERIRGRLMGSPVSLALHTEDVGGARAHVVELSGALVPASWPGGLTRFLEGEAPAQLRVEVPADWGRGERATVHLTSELAGLAVNLPAPLGKAPAHRQRLDVTARVGRDAVADAQARFGDVRGHVALNWGDGPIRVQRLRLVLGGGVASPADPGTIRIEGRCPRLSLPAWKALVGGGPRRLALPSTLVFDMQMDRLDLGGRTLHNLSVDGSRTARRLEANFQSQEVAGRLHWQLEPDDRPLYANLRYLNLAPGRSADDTDAASGIDPAGIPPLRVSVERLAYKGIPLGRMNLDTEPRDSALQIVGVDIQGERLRGSFEGYWHAGRGGERTEIEGRVRSPDIAALLSAFGYAGGVTAEQSQTRFSLAWPGPPRAFSAKALDGELYVRLDQGRLLDVSPGAGRVFGLLSLQALPRRLSLDFSDLFNKGLAFDRLGGNFKITDGQAHTEDLILTGPAADVAVTGRVGLADEDFDQVVTVTPNLSSTLPVAGTIAGGPGVGAALYLTQRLFKRQIDQASSLRYRVQGSWSNPTVQPVEDTTAAQQ